MQTETPPKTGAFDPSYPSLAREYLKLRPQNPTRKAAKGQLIVQEGDRADYSLLLLEGWLALYKTLPDGDTQIFDIMLPGDFALIGAKGAPVAACSLEALSDAAYVLVKPDSAYGPGPEMEKLRALIAAALVNLQARTSELVLRLGRSSAAARLAYGLVELHVRLEAIELSRGGCFELPMTQLQIGQFVGLSNVHVCRTMRRFERDGIISYKGPGAICLLDIDALCRIAGTDLDTFRAEILTLHPR